MEELYVSNEKVTEKATQESIGIGFHIHITHDGCFNEELANQGSSEPPTFQYLYDDDQGVHVLECPRCKTVITVYTREILTKGFRIPSLEIPKEEV